MATVGTVAVDLVANTGGFSQPVQHASAQLETLHQDLERIASAGENAIGFFTRLAGVALSAEGALTSIEEAMNRVADATRLAERLGVTATELEQFHYAATLSGIGIEKFDGALEVLTRKIGQADDPTGKTAAKFERLGFSMEALAAESPLKAFQEIADKIRSLPTPAEKAAAAFDLFGKKGQSILNLILQDSDAFESLKDRALACGSALNSIDNEKILAAHHSILEMKESVSGLWNKLSVDIAPAIKEVADGLSHLIESIESGNNKTIIWIGRIAEFGVAFLAASKVVQVVTEAILAMAAAYKALAAGEAVAEAFANPLGFALSASLAAGAVGVVENALSGLSEASSAAAKAAADRTAEITKTQGELTKQISKDEKHELKEMAKELEEWAQKVQQVHDELRTPIEKFADQIRSLQALMQHGLSDDDFARGIQKAADDLAKANAIRVKSEKRHDMAAVQKGSSAALVEEQRILTERFDLQERQLELETAANDNLIAIRAVLENNKPGDAIDVKQVKL